MTESRFRSVEIGKMGNLMWNNFYSGKHVGTRHLNTFQTITGHRHQHYLKTPTPSAHRDGQKVAVSESSPRKHGGRLLPPFGSLLTDMAHVRAPEVEMFSLLTPKTTSVGNALGRNNWGHYTAENPRIPKSLVFLDRCWPQIFLKMRKMGESRFSDSLSD